MAPPVGAIVRRPRDDLDAVITATPWEGHVPVMLAALDAGKYGATEVPAAVTVDECADEGKRRWRASTPSTGTATCTPRTSRARSR